MRYLVIVGKSKVVDNVVDEEAALKQTIAEFEQEIKEAEHSISMVASVTETPTDFVSRPIITGREVVVAVKEVAVKAPPTTPKTRKRKAK